LQTRLRGLWKAVSSSGSSKEGVLFTAIVLRLTAGETDRLKDSWK
jgi:hypothetical protein